MKKLNKQLLTIRTQLSTEKVSIDSSQHQSLFEIIKDNIISDPFIKLFWEEQKKAFSRAKRGHVWHPMMIRMAILLHSQSPSAYRTLQDIGILKLPGESTLQDYTNFVKPSPGFHIEILKEIKEAADKLTSNHQKWINILFDEMSIKSHLVFDRENGNVIGFINRSTIGDLSSNIATHCLVLMAVGITSSLKYSLAWFPTKSTSASDLYTIFWEAVAHLETYCHLKVISAMCDKVVSNMKFIAIHGKEGITYKTPNLFANDTPRDIYFISDPPHLLKTVRNNLSTSGSNKNTRFLSKNGKNILWKHIVDVYNKDIQNELSRASILTYNHIHLNSYSVMKVNLAAQVMSMSVAKIMEEYGGNEAS
ncbi:uncharacterized protein LOC126827139 [Patella vulgata]|uniref:uncharacterized protein LOC126827139 n=1 Tax=Patella vulgata TaxID=6465 RepID=UPI0021804F85|nr:uncharacterized protein LOC126827139 [Patella vulgata]XP_050412328.1 uncharacterized protein LOC126827139 [Patella vulgata]